MKKLDDHVCFNYRELQDIYDIMKAGLIALKNNDSYVNSSLYVRDFKLMDDIWYHLENW